MRSTQPEVWAAARLPPNSVRVIMLRLERDTPHSAGDNRPPNFSLQRRSPSLLEPPLRPLAAGFVRATGGSAAATPGSAAPRQCCRTSGTSLRNGVFRDVYLSVKAPLVRISATQLTRTKYLHKTSMEYAFGQFGSAVLPEPPPHLFLTPSQHSGLWSGQVGS